MLQIMLLITYNLASACSSYQIPVSKRVATASGSAVHKPQQSAPSAAQGARPPQRRTPPYPARNDSHPIMAFWRCAHPGTPLYSWAHSEPAAAHPHLQVLCQSIGPHAYPFSPHAYASPQVIMYSKVYCPYCIKAKNALNQFIKADQYKVVEVRERPRGFCPQCYYGLRAHLNRKTHAHGFREAASVCLRSGALGPDTLGLYC